MGVWITIPPYFIGRDPMHQLTVDLLTERCATHGDYTNHAEATQALKLAILNTICRPWLDYSAAQREALDMIAHKLGRILAGDPDFADHWRDIAGYATLVADRCSK